jgi:hypothetical protein
MPGSKNQQQSISYEIDNPIRQWRVVIIQWLQLLYAKQSLKKLVSIEQFCMKKPVP